MECWGALRDFAHGWSGLSHRGRARPNSPRKGGRQLGFNLDLKVALGGCRALVAPRPLPSATQTWTREVLSLTVSAGGLRSLSTRRSARHISMGRARRSLVTFDVERKAPFSTSDVFRFSNTREYATNPLL